MAMDVADGPTVTGVSVEVIDLRREGAVPGGVHGRSPLEIYNAWRGEGREKIPRSAPFTVMKLSNGQEIELIMIRILDGPDSPSRQDWSLSACMRP